MATLTVPRATWQSPPNARISFIETNLKGDRIIFGMDNGTLIISKFINSILTPMLFCIGPVGSIISLVCYKIDLESPATEDNVVVSCNDKGDIALWSLLDGQCLQTRHERNDGVQGILQGIKVHSGGNLVCFGQCNSLVILDATTLEILQSFDLFRSWVVAITLSNLESGKDRLMLVDADGILHSMILDLDAMTCVTESKKSGQLPAHTMGNSIDVGFNPFDPKLFFVLEKDFCEILLVGFHSICRIPKDGDAFYKGAQFLSARTVLLWDENGGLFLYYLGSSSNLLFGNCQDLNPSDVVLISDGSNAVYVENLTLGPYPLYSTCTLVGTFATNGCRARIRTVPSNSTDLRSFILGFSTDRLQEIKVRVFSYYCSLFASNLPKSTANTPKLISPMLQIQATKTFDMKDQFWEIPKIESKFTVMTIFMKQYIAVGYSIFN